MYLCPTNLKSLPAERLALLESSKREARIRLEEREKTERLKREKIIKEMTRKEEMRIKNPAMESAFPQCKEELSHTLTSTKEISKKTKEENDFPKYCQGKKEINPPDPKHSDGICMPFRSRFNIEDPCDPDCHKPRKPEIRTSDFYFTDNLPQRFEYPKSFKGYGETRQPPLHPFYRTTSSEYSYITPNVHVVPPRYYPKCSFFSNFMSKRSNYKRGSLNFALDPIYYTHTYTR